jgi:hypothetical protein
MNSNMLTLKEELADCRDRAQKLVEGLTQDELTRRPDPCKWSIAECLAHLNVTAGVVQSLIAQAIERGKKDKLFGTGPFTLGAKGRLLLWIAEPPPKFRLRAPKSVVPPISIGNPAQVLPDFLKVQDEWERLWKEAEGLDMARVNIGPRLSLFCCHLSASFPWMMAHQRRHLLQAENVKRQICASAASA